MKLLDRFHLLFYGLLWGLIVLSFLLWVYDWLRE